MEIEERRQLAREAFYADPSESPIDSLETAIGTATRVWITEEISNAAADIEDAFGREEWRAAVGKIFEVAGFEVIE